MPSPSGLTVDGVPIPQEIEGAGGAAIADYLLDHLPSAAPQPDAAPPTTAEGAE
jgi:hypothetical protein